MAINSPYVDSLIITWHTDSEGKKVSVLRENEQQKIVNGKITLSEIPDEFYGVTISGYNEVKYGKIINETDFKVNYALGEVAFHPSQEGKTITINSYYGRGCIYYPSSRIYYTTNINGDIESTLQDYINSVSKYLYKGIYDNNTIYSQNNIVYYNGSTYICINDNNGVGISGINPNNLSYWRVLAAGYQYRGEYDNSIVYYNRDIITYNNSTYLCISQTSQGNHPTNNSYWKLISAGFNYLGDYDNTIQYYPRDVVSYAGNTYVCVVSNIGEIPFNSGKWSLFAQRGENFFYYDSGVEITHNLNTYNVMALAVTENTYGHGGYGNFGMGNYLQLETMIEYVNTNTIRLHFSESFLGTPTLTTLISGQSYRIDFSEEATPVFVYLK